MFEFLTNEAAINLVYVPLIGWALKILNDRFRLDLEEKQIDRVKGGIANLTRAAMLDGKTDAREIASLAVGYLTQTMPDTYAKVSPTQEAINRLVQSTMQSELVGQVRSRFDR